MITLFYRLNSFIIIYIALYVNVYVYVKRLVFTLGKETVKLSTTDAPSKQYVLIKKQGRKNIIKQSADFYPPK